jgi:glycine C-acetyltransferase
LIVPELLQGLFEVIAMTQLSARPQLAYLTATLDDLRAKGTYFKLRILDDQQVPVCNYDGRQVINLASNNYLGLANHPLLPGRTEARGL